jgi:hypothetical protein
MVTALMAFSLPAGAIEGVAYPEYTGPEFQALYEHAVENTLPNLDPPKGKYEITGNDDLDERIWSLAFQRGYVLRPTAAGNLASVGGVPMQPQAADAWAGLRVEARAAGMPFIVSSAYRSPSAQRTQFLSKLSGTSDSAIDATLTWWSVPGTSKHHGGYALDFRHAGGSFGQFRSTADHAWLSADNFAIPKQYGLIPSYPDDVDNQGPNPEPWEYVWVGTGLIRCGIPQTVGPPTAGPAAALVEDLGRCPGGSERVDVPEWLSP